MGWAKVERAQRRRDFNLTCGLKVAIDGANKAIASLMESVSARPRSGCACEMVLTGIKDPSERWLDSLMLDTARPGARHNLS